MIIDRNIKQYSISSLDTVSHALYKINENKAGIIFIINSDGILEGALSDGDIRRWLIISGGSGVNSQIAEVGNKNFKSAKLSDPREKFLTLLNEKIRYLPLVDELGRLVAIASNRTNKIYIDKFTISKDDPVFVIAEIGNNHNGSIDCAIELVNQAKKSGADCVKFQMRSLKATYRQDSKGGASDDLGAQYTLDLLAKFQLTNDELFKVFDYCKSQQILPLCTPWDIPSLLALDEYGMEAFKIASADLTNHEFIRQISRIGKPLIASTGMSSEVEIMAALELLHSEGVPFAILHCNSTYPAPFKDINLNYMNRLMELSGGVPVGYSGHERGISIALAAVAKGAKIIEKHFTLDRNMEGNDHRVSLLPSEFESLVKGIREIEQALGSASERVVTQGELMNRETLGKSLIATRGIVIGQEIRLEHVTTQSPGSGLQPYFKDQLIGTIARREIREGDFFYPSDLKGGQMEAVKNYKFIRPFGVPVRYHDALTLSSKTNLDFLEFHLSYKDLDLDPSDFLPIEGLDLGYVVHSPDLFENDHIMDLCSDSEEYLSRSIYELKRVIDVTKKLRKYFHKSVDKPFVIVSVSAYTDNEFLSISDRKFKYQKLASVLKSVDLSGVEIIIQTMPPFPWYFGGQRYCNLFMDQDEILSFCKENNFRICLDLSHSKLACNYSKQSFGKYLDSVLPYTAHMHLVDARGIDGEGVQVGDGEIDFVEFFKKCNSLAPKASFIPEIWQGHKNDGEAFWIALSRLEEYSAEAIGE